MRKLLLIAALTLSACAHRPVPPAVVTRTITVDRPVAVACVAPVDVPAMPDAAGAYLTGNAVDDLDLVAASAIRLRAALDKALALLGACVIAP